MRLTPILLLACALSGGCEPQNEPGSEDADRLDCTGHTGGGFYAFVRYTTMSEFTTVEQLDALCNDDVPLDLACRDELQVYFLAIATEDGEDLISRFNDSTLLDERYFTTCKEPLEFDGSFVHGITIMACDEFGAPNATDGLTWRSPCTADGDAAATKFNDAQRLSCDETAAIVCASAWPVAPA